MRITELENTNQLVIMADDGRELLTVAVTR